MHLFFNERRSTTSKASTVRRGRTSATRHMRGRAALQTVLVLSPMSILAGCGHNAEAPRATPPSNLAAVQLTTRDVPRGFYLERRLTLNPNETARGQHIDPLRYARHGGGASLSELFVLHHPTDIGITVIFTQVFQFSSSANARWGFTVLRAATGHSGTIGTEQQYVTVGATPTPLPTLIAIIKHPLPPPVTQYTPVRAPAIGAQSAGFTNTSAAYAGEYVFTNQALLFQDGQYCVIVHISGNYGQVPMSAATALARRIERRIPLLKR